MGLDTPCDHIGEVLVSGATILGKTIKLKNFDNQMVVRPDLQAAAKHLIASFRTGKFGTICLDQQKLEMN